jgi:sulfatase maturation enzyme AslB (radical SAM superfamily)
MVSLEQTANNYCSLAYSGLFYHNNSAASCCAMETRPSSPIEYNNSEETKKLRDDFTAGLKPEPCRNCWSKEEHGHKSIRSYFMEPRDHTKVTHMELRESNLCNFSCRMCDGSSSNIIDKEVKANPQLSRFVRKYEENKPTTNENWQQILDMSKDLESVILTGGEPMLMKRYYDFLDHLIAIGKQDIEIFIYTNGSVYNPLFVERLKKFPNLALFFSIDAVGKIAEYQRHGTDWNVVRGNILRYAELPIKIKLHSTLTAYSILGVSQLADFFVELKSSPINAKFMPFTAHFAKEPAGVSFTNLNLELRQMAIKQIDQALEKLEDAFPFKTYRRELLAGRNQLINAPEGKFLLFRSMSEEFDKVRNESFEDVFGYKLY